MNIFVGVPVRDSEDTLKPFLKSLISLDYPKDKLGVLFYINNSFDSSSDIIKGFASKFAHHYGTISIKKPDISFQYREPGARDIEFYSNMAKIRNAIVSEFMRRGRYSKLLFVDSDVVLHKSILSQLANSRKKIVGPLLDVTDKSTNVHRYTNKPVSINPSRGLAQVDSISGCAMVDRSVFESGCRFRTSSDGEFLSFCVSARMKGFQVWCINKKLAQHIKVKKEVVSKKIKNKPSSIAITCYSGIGDAIYASAIATAIKRKTGVSPDVFSGDYGVNIFPHNNNINKISRERQSTSFFSSKYDEVYILDVPLYRKISRLKDKPYKVAYSKYFTLINKMKSSKDSVWIDFVGTDALSMANNLFSIDASLDDCPISVPGNSLKIDQPYVTLHDWAARGRQTKNWFPEKWKDVVDNINKMGFNVYQIGESKAYHVPGTVSLLGKTTIAESISLINGAALHLGIDSSMTHIAALLKTKCISVWGPTPVSYWGHDENVNIVAKTDCVNCWGYCFGSDWWSKCVRGKNIECMRSISPSIVIDEADLLLRNVRPVKKTPIVKSDLRQPRIGFYAWGGIGDAIMNSAIIKKIGGKFNPSSMDVFSADLSETMFKSMPHLVNTRKSKPVSNKAHVKDICPVSDYDLFINLFPLPTIEHHNKNIIPDGFISTYNSRWNYYKKFDALMYSNAPLPEKLKDYFEKNHIETANELFSIDAKITDALIPINRNFDIIEPYVTIHNGAARGIQTKCYFKDRLASIVDYIRGSFKMRVYHVGSSGEEQIPGTVSIIGETTIPQAMYVIKNSMLHIDIDSSLTHAAAAFGVPCIAIWGPTSVKYWGHKQNINIVSAGDCHNCFGYRRDWWKRCIKGKDRKCMRELSEEAILEKIDSVFSRFKGSSPKKATRSKNVAIVTESGFDKKVGGAEVQYIKTSEYIKSSEDLALSVSTVKGMQKNLRKFGAIHVFNSTAHDEGIAQMILAKKANVPIFFSTIYWDQKELVKFYYKTMFPSGNKDMWTDIIRNYGFEKKRNVIKQRTADVLLPNSNMEGALLNENGCFQPCHVVPNAADRVFMEGDKGKGSDIVGLKDYVLCVGRMEFRKNQIGIIKAMRGLNIPVVFVGRRYIDEYDSIVDKEISSLKNFKIIDHINHEDLRHVYAAAKVHVLPSLYETPGLATLEAALAGCSVVVSPGGCTTEYFKDFAVYCNPLDPQSIKEAILESYESERGSNGLIDRILKKYLWENTVEATINAYEKYL